MKKIRIIGIVVIVSILFVSFIFSSPKEIEVVYKDNLIEKEFVYEKENTLTISAAGDVLMHMPVLNSAKTGNTYDFTNMYKGVKHLFDRADLSMINLEVPVAGNKLAISSYPMFNSPVEVLDGLKYLGIDVISTANNHSLDKSYKGLETTIENIKQKEMLWTGTARNLDEAKPLIITKNNIKVGVISYTYGTNGIPVPSSKPYCVNLIDENKIKSDIEYLKTNNVDFIVSNIHFGIEYQTKPSTYQKETVDFLVENGVDAIFGSHPHVPQPYEIRYNEKLDKNVFIIYSLGNFVSNQDWATTQIGGIAEIKLYKKGNIKDVTSAIVHPIYTYNNNSRNHKVVSLREVVNTQGIYTGAQMQMFKKALNDVKYIYNKEELVLK